MMRPKYLTLRDTTLPHQVVLFTQTGSYTIWISCNCRLSANASDKKLFYDPIGETLNLEESRALYNDPNNHRTDFTEADKAKW